VVQQLQQVASLPEEQFDFTDELWVKVVYEFASSYRRSVINRDHIIQALAPLYRGRAYHFITQNQDVAPDALEQRVEALCASFERLKPYLVSLWTA
jgi:glucosylglycerate synthase